MEPGNEATCTVCTCTEPLVRRDPQPCSVYYSIYADDKDEPNLPQWILVRI